MPYPDPRTVSKSRNWRRRPIVIFNGRLCVIDGAAEAAGGGRQRLNGRPARPGAAGPPLGGRGDDSTYIELGRLQRKCARPVPNRNPRPIGVRVKKKPTYQPSSPAVAARVLRGGGRGDGGGPGAALPTGMEPLQRALAARIRHATTQLLACADQLDTDEADVLGSTGQRIPHPLLKTEQAFAKK